MGNKEAEMLRDQGEAEIQRGTGLPRDAFASQWGAAAESSGLSVRLRAGLYTAHIESGALCANE